MTSYSTEEELRHRVRHSIVFLEAALRMLREMLALLEPEVTDDA